MRTARPTEKKGDITDDGYKSSEEWSGVKERRVSSPVAPRNTPPGDNQIILSPDLGKLSSQEGEMNLRNHSKLITFNLEDFDPVDTAKESQSKGLGKLMSSVEKTHQNCSRGQDRNVEPSGIPEKDILVNKEDEQTIPTATNALLSTNNEQTVPTPTTDSEGDDQIGDENANLSVPIVSKETRQDSSVSPPMQIHRSQILQPHCCAPITNQLSGAPSDDIRSSPSSHGAGNTGPGKISSPPLEDSICHSLVHHQDTSCSTELMETYTLYVDVRKDRRTRLFLSSVRVLQEVLEDVYPNGSSTSIMEISIPIASFRPKSWEALDDLSKLLDKEIREFIQEQEAFPGIMVSFNQFGFNSRGTVETEIMAGRDKIQELKRRVILLGVEDLLPIEFDPHTLTVFQGCRQDQGVRENVENLKENLFLGALCAPEATLRVNDQSVSEGKHHKKVVKTFSLKLIDLC